MSRLSLWERSVGLVPGGAGQPCAVMCGRQRFVRKQLIAFFFKKGKSWGYIMKLVGNFETGVPFISWCSDTLKLMVVEAKTDSRGILVSSGDKSLFGHWE